MAGISSLRSSDLSGLLADTVEQHPSSLETFVLDNTGVDDEGAVYISSCPMLRSLEVAGTKFTS
jgi:hypothetical protein